MTEHVELPADWREQINALSLTPSKIPALVESWRPVPAEAGAVTPNCMTREDLARALCEHDGEDYEERRAQDDHGIWVGYANAVWDAGWRPAPAEAGDKPLPPFVLRPVLHDPDVTYQWDEDGEPVPGTDVVGWDMTSGCRVNFGQHDAGGYLFHLSLFGDVLKRGVEQRTVTAEQVQSFARQLLALLPAEADVDPDPEWIADGAEFGTGANAGDSTADETPAVPKNAPKILLQVLQQAYDAGSEGESVSLRDMAERFLAGWRPASSVRDTAETAAGCQYQVVPGAESSENGLCLHSSTDGQYCNRHAEVRRMYGLSTESLPAPADTEGGAR
jgi:hypothetical protein